MSDRFDGDPEALAWARGHVQEFIDRLADFEQQAKAKGDPITEYGCGVARAMAERHFLGDGGGAIGAFDDRRLSTAGSPERPVSGEETNG
jgi:hypothetical protein